MKTKLWIYLILAPLLGVLLAGARVYYLMEVWTYQGPEVHFKISSGEGFSSINYRLKKEQLISNSTLFHRYNQFQNQMNRFKSGTFAIKSGSNMKQLIYTLLNSSPITIKVTVPEGKNIYEIAKIFSEQMQIDESTFLSQAKDSFLVKSLKIEGETVEGYLYPETYFFEPESSAQTIIKTMVNTFKQKTKDLSFNGKYSKHEIVILASVVEKETGAKFERPIISGVFHNRLNKKMRLQSDPTTIYGIYESYKGNLQKKHLLEETPYNTYKISGLPIGPICNPGREAIEAALSPDNHDFFYFVSQNDGTHIFSKSYSDHAKAVDQYQKNYKNRQGKSWRDLNKKTNN
jgi:UPF0755 protein